MYVLMHTCLNSSLIQLFGRFAAVLMDLICVDSIVSVFKLLMHTEILLDYYS